MAAPRHIVDALECVLQIYFSNARHKERAAFLLCDELVEVTCREKIKINTPTLGNMKFHQLLEHPDVALDNRVHPLGQLVYACHRTRNDMQHNNPAATVDAQHCADAIVDAVEVIEHCFPGAKTALPDKLKVTLRVIRLYSQHGDPHHQADFASTMRDHTWRGDRERARRDEAFVAPGQRNYWGLVIPSEYAQVEALLNRVGVPPF
jgi:hypothetical protein